MSTRSDIIVEHESGVWARIYCHNDGYLEHNGAILQEHYNTQALAEAVVAPGDMSSLERKCSKPPRDHSFDKRKPGYCVYYGRDRGEKDTDATLAATLAEVWPEDSGTEYTYVWRQGLGWFVGDADEGPDSLKPLAQVLAGIVEEPKPNVKAFGGNCVIATRK